MIGFIDLLYEANENDGFASVTFGVTFGVLSIGALQREVRVGIQLSDGTALSKQLTNKQTELLKKSHVKLATFFLSCYIINCTASDTVFLQGDQITRQTLEAVSLPSHPR